MINTEPLYRDIEELVLHRPPMLLVHALTEWDAISAEVLVNTQDSALFAETDGRIPAWVGIEYMAQAVSAYAGILAKQNGEPLCLGFLLGTRRYSTNVSHFSAGEQLRICVKELLRDETNLVLFDCHIYRGIDLLATAEIKAIQPKDAASTLLLKN